MNHCFYILLEKELQILISRKQLDRERVFIAGNASDPVTCCRDHGDRVIHERQTVVIVRIGYAAAELLIGSPNGIDQVGKRSRRGCARQVRAQPAPISFDHVTVGATRALKKIFFPLAGSPETIGRFGARERR